jgi:hypothetical protein
MTAHWVVIAAAALTTLVAAAAAAALTVFTGQALPQVVKHDLAIAHGSALSVTALVNEPGTAAAGSTGLRSQIAAALPGIPFSFDEALWSDPLELVPGSLPAQPPGAGQGNTALVQAASMSGISGHARLLAGHWPAAATSRGQLIPAALPAAAAALLHVSTGDVLRLRDQITSATVRFVVTGVFVERDEAAPANSYWGLSYVPASGKSVSYQSVTYGPLVVSQADFGSALTLLSGSWVAQPDMAAFADGDLGAAAGGVAALTQSLPNSAYLNGAQLVTSLPTVLNEAASNLTVARSLLVISALELLVLAIAALLAVAGLLAAQREGESALLAARGATRSQLTWLTAVEVIPLSALVSLAGAVAGLRLADLLVSEGPLGRAGITLAGSAGGWPGALAAAAAVTVLAAAALLAPGLSLSPGAARARRGRGAKVAGAARAGLDIALVVLAVLACWQLRHFSVASNGGAGLDPVLALAPALALAAGGVATLRLLPLAARGADWLAVRGRRLTGALASWQLSRMPARQGGAALLLTLAVATGTLALGQHASWDKSASDQAVFATGGDVQVDPPVPLTAGATGALTGARGVTGAMAVSDNDTSAGEVIAIGTAEAARVVRLRADESPLPAARLFAAVTPAAAGAGAVLAEPQPGAPAGTIHLGAVLGPATEVPAAAAARLSAALGPVSVTLTVLDRTGAAYQLPAGTLAADGRPHPLTASLGGDQARYPLRVTAIAAAFLQPLRAGPSVTLALSGLPLAGWTQQVIAPLPVDLPDNEVVPPADGRTRVSAQAAAFTFAPGHAPLVQVSQAGGQTQVPAQLTLLPRGVTAASVPAIATRAFADANNLTAGSVVPASLGGTQVPLRIAAVVTSFPTVTAADGALITDLGSLQEYLARQSLPPLSVSQWWLSTTGGTVPAGLSAALPAGTVVTGAAALAAATEGDSLSAAPQQALLAMAAAAALLAVTGFWVSIAADVRRRRGETALLAALGVTRRGAAAQLCLEKLLLSVPAAALGVLLGELIAQLLVPAVTLNAAAQLPTPPVIIVDDLPQAIALALAVAVLPAVAAALGAVRRPDPAAELRAAEEA